MALTGRADGSVIDVIGAAVNNDTTSSSTNRAEAVVGTRLRTPERTASKLFKKRSEVKVLRRLIVERPGQGVSESQVRRDKIVRYQVNTSCTYIYMYIYVCVYIKIQFVWLCCTMTFVMFLSLSFFLRSCKSDYCLYSCQSFFLSLILISYLLFGRYSLP